MLRAYILSIGSELTQGHLTDTNATFLAQELNAIGAELLHVVQCSDHRGRLTAQLKRAIDEADLVICTGGIGPTEDDLTREAIADAVGETPTISEPLLAEIRAFFAGRGLTMPERNGKQAWIIPSSDVLPNPIGTAPGWFVYKDGKAIVAMPGVPREMKRMWSEQALPRINERLSGEKYSAITIKTIGIGESALEDSIQDLVAVENPIVATYAKDDGVHVRVTGIAESVVEAVALRDAAVDEIRRRVARHIYAYDSDPLAVVLARLIERHGLRLAINDHGGGGQFASMMLGEPESARVVVAAISSSSDHVPAPLLAAAAAGVDPLTLGVGIAVSAEPTQSTGTGQIRVALSHPHARSEESAMRSSFSEIQRRSMMVAADVLHRALSDRG
jgi:nicotinamide-nucleotide amidase